MLKYKNNTAQQKLSDRADQWQSIQKCEEKVENRAGKKKPKKRTHNGVIWPLLFSKMFFKIYVITECEGD